MVAVIATASGGNGGQTPRSFFGSTAGSGGSITLTNAVAGSTSGILNLTQTANGGTGGDSGGVSTVAIAGKGGDASSALTFGSNSAVQLNASNYATAGHGGNAPLTLLAVRAAMRRPIRM
jgi:hypothetical protein